MADKYTLVDAAAEEMGLFYSSYEIGHDQETGCIGHLRQDFGRNGKEFHTSWDDHCSELKTQAFKDEFDDVINTLRTGILKDRNALTAYCNAHSQAKINDGRDYSYGFKLKTDNHVYYLRCCTLKTDNNLYCYAYNRETLEKRFPALAEIVMTDELRSMLEKAAAFIIEKSARETTSGNYIIGADDIPADILPSELFERHIATIAAIMEDYNAVADAGFTSNGEIDVIIYSDYCPNYEPLPEEQGDFSPDRRILDPLKSKRVPEPEKPIPAISAPKPTLTERIAKNKEKAATQGKTDAPKSKKREEIT